MDEGHSNLAMDDDDDINSQDEDMDLQGIDPLAEGEYDFGLGLPMPDDSTDNQNPALMTFMTPQLEEDQVVIH